MKGEGFLSRDVLRCHLGCLLLGCITYTCTHVWWVPQFPRCTQVWFWDVGTMKLSWFRVESWAKELMFTILSSAGSHVHRRPRGSSEVAEEQSWWTGGRVASHKNSPWQMDMHVYIFYLWNNQKRGVESTFRACELPSSKMYLTPMQLAGMNLPSFRHVVVAWKNFNDTQYDTIHGLYLWSSYRDHIHTKNICYIYIRCKS